MSDAMKMIVLKMAIPVVQSIIRDIIVDANLHEVRDDIIAWMLKVAKKTDTPIDDNLVKAVTEVLFTPEHVGDLLGIILPRLREYVASSSTQWDDFLFLPVLDVIESVFRPEHHSV